MNVKTLAVAASVSVPLILSGSASGGFVGISTTSKPNEFGLFVVNIYAEFDRPGEDHMIGVAGTSLTPLLIEVIGGVFYNHPFGNDHAPNPSLIEFFPSLAYDSFYTIGKKSSAGVEDLIISANMNPPNGSTIQTTVGGWFVPTDAPQGNPFDPANSFPGDGQILIGQFSTADGSAIQGTMLLEYIISGVVTHSVVSFQHPLAQPCPWDCGGDDDGNVGIVDFLALLAQWGTPGSCDFDGCGVVGITDLLALLANWGPCP